MKKSKSFQVAVIAIFLSLSFGCASTLRSKTEKIRFESDPAGAKVTLSTGQSCITPCSLELERGLVLRAEYTKNNYRSESVLLGSKISGGAVALSVIGGLPGLLIDSVNSEKLTKYDPNPCVVKLYEEAKENYVISSGTDASNESLTISDIEDRIPKGVLGERDDVAVVIANNNYEVDGVPAVDYAINDGDTFVKYLSKTLGYDENNIIYIKNATLTKFNQVFGSDRDFKGKLYNYVNPGKSRVFVYYVGHGAPDVETGDAYFVPVDADPQYLKNGGYRLETFYENLAKLPAKKITVVLDACFSGGSQKGFLFSGISPAMLKTNSSLKVDSANNMIVFASGNNDQVSTWYTEKKHSLFTYYFLSGLNGKADTDKDDVLTVAEMRNYLNENVPYMARRLSGRVQTPAIHGSSDDVVAVLKGPDSRNDK